MERARAERPLGLQVGLTKVMSLLDTFEHTPATALPRPAADEPAILEEIEVEDLAVDGICGVY